ncbi:histone-like nucleoid-structuring protein Lsr2 [Rhodococcus sp. NPDC004095]
MARQQVVQYVVTDDFDGKKVDENLAVAVEFSWDGKDYRLDLRPENYDKIKGDFEKWIAAAAEVKPTRGGRASSGTRKSSASGRSKEELAQIRKWAAENGHEVSSRGRIAQEIQDAYDQAHA